MPPEDVRRLVDIEAGLDEGQLSQVRFGRRRFLRTMSLALFGVATGMVSMSQQAEARRAPGGCTGARGCNCCSNGSCCETGCSDARTYCGGVQCWTVCYQGRQVQCCDYTRKNGSICMCHRTVDPIVYC